MIYDLKKRIKYYSTFLNDLGDRYSQSSLNETFEVFSPGHELTTLTCQKIYGRIVNPQMCNT